MALASSFEPAKKKVTFLDQVWVHWTDHCGYFYKTDQITAVKAKITCGACMWIAAQDPAKICPKCHGSGLALDSDVPTAKCVYCIGGLINDK